ncbi:MAG: ImmA/IrrE family metallo-endopeptidase [Porcipelethomonas sp.]
MARYATLKDYFQRVHLELIRSVISDYLISELKDDRQIKNPVVQSLECVNDDAYFNVEVELGISADLIEKDCEEKSETLFFMITIAGNLKLKFEDIRVIRVRKVNDNEFPEDNILSQFILPDLPVKSLERIGSGLYSLYKRCAGFKELQLSLESIIKIIPIFFSDLPDDCLGRINMLESDIDIFYYNLKERRQKNEKRHAQPGTILINKKKYYDELDGELLITVAHELIHWQFHQRFFMLLTLLGVESDVMNCRPQPVVLNDSMTDIQKALCIAEWQANALAMRLAIPESTVDAAIKEIAYDPSTYYENLGDRMQACVIRFAKAYGVSCFVAKKRLRQLGHDYVDGTIIELDKEKKQPFYFLPGTLRDNETFVIDRTNYERLLQEDNEFAELIESGVCIYVGYVVCIYDAKYIKPSINNEKISYNLTDYARDHAEECCLKFSVYKKEILNEKDILYGPEYLCNVADNNEFEFQYIKNDEQEKFFQMKADNNLRDKLLLDEINKAGITTFSEALKYIMDKVCEPCLKKKDLAGFLGCDEKTIQNYRNGKSPDTVEKVMLICYKCKLGQEVGYFLIEKSVGGIPNDGVKRAAYNMMLSSTNLSFEIWSKIPEMHQLPPISFK